MDKLAKVCIRIICIFASGNDTVSLISNVQDDFIFFDINNSAFDYLSIMNCFE